MMSGHCGHVRRGRPLSNDFADKQDKQHAEQQIQSQKPDQGKEGIPRMHERRSALRRTQEAIHQPGLPPQLGGHPPSRRRNIWERSTQHQPPQQPLHVEQPASPQRDEGYAKEEDEKSSPSPPSHGTHSRGAEDYPATRREETHRAPLLWHRGLCTQEY